MFKLIFRGRSFVTIAAKFNFCIQGQSPFQLKKQSLLKLLAEQDIHIDQNEQTHTDPFAYFIQQIHSIPELSYYPIIKQKMNASQIDNDMLLYVFNQLEEQTHIHQVIEYLHDRLDHLTDAQLLLVFQKIMAYKPPKLPKVPKPRNLSQIQLILLCFSEIYPAYKLMEWVELIPLWEGDESNLQILSMGYFAIYEKLNTIQRNKHAKLLFKCNQKIQWQVKSAQPETFLTVLMLALEMNNPIATKLIVMREITIEQLEIERICLLLINIARFNNLDSAQIKKVFKNTAHQLIEYLMRLDWAQFMKISIFVQLWRIIKIRYEGMYKDLLEKLISFTLKQSYGFNFYDLTAKEVVDIIDTCESLSVNNKQLLVKLIDILAINWNNLQNADLVKLTQCMITYIRQIEPFFMEIRKKCEERKLTFTQDQLKELNKVFDRCRVLFNKPLLIACQLNSIDHQYSKGNIKIGTITPLSHRWTISLLLRIGQTERIVQFIIDTASKYNFITPQTLRQFNVSTDKFMCQVEGIRTQATISESYYKQYNIIGSQYLCLNRIDIKSNFKQCTFELIFPV